MPDARVEVETEPTVTDSPSDPDSEPQVLRLVAYEHTNTIEPAVTRAIPQRDWMDQTPQRFAYRCLPLVIANQCGWMVRCPFEFAAVWDGRPNMDAIRLAIPPGQRGFGPDPAQNYVSSHFGSGILTFSMPYLFRTPPGYNLWVKGPTNQPKDGIQPLEGMVETDWTHATFTMNWLFTRPRNVIKFQVGEPICQVLPYPRGLIESFDPIIAPITDDPELHAAFVDWREDRRSFNEDLRVPGTKASQQKWQKDYHQGRTADGQKYPSHQTHLQVREFRREG